MQKFTSVDPLAEKKPWISPYVYCSNNPVNKIDPDGMDDVYTRQGKFVEHNNHEIDKKQDHIVIRDQNYVKKALVSLGLGNTKMVKNMSDNIDTRIERTTLSAEAYSNVFTNALSDTKGVNMSNLYNGSVSVVVSHNDYDVDDQYNSPSLQSEQNASAGSVDGQTRITASIINSGDKDDNRFLFQLHQMFKTYWALMRKLVMDRKDGVMPQALITKFMSINLDMIHGKIQLNHLKIT